MFVNYWKNDEYRENLDGNPFYRRKKNAAITEQGQAQLAAINAIELRDTLQEHIIGDFTTIKD